ncbi:uncharacterized protein METZ01_LOCUS236883 [marine metagenome]|uniref:VTT domain-containing protein n=1 Tax=marine metagenome TaxID=408172 RepID=A0A382HA54_9ZZZZ
MNKKIILLIVIGIGITSLYFLDIKEYLSFENLKANRDRLNVIYQENSIIFISWFIGIYFLTVSFSLPGATILTLAAGAIFGSVLGVLLVNIGATLGATAAFLSARFIFRDWVEGKFSDKLSFINSGISGNAFSYLLFLRLVPVFPFFLVNLILGLTQVRLSIYFFGTMLGIMPGSFVYAFAGSNLANINSVSDIASPKVFGALVLLGIFTLIPTVYSRYK